MTQSTLKQASGVIFVYNTLSNNSFEALLSYWIPMVMSNVKKGTKFMLIGNKTLCACVENRVFWITF